MAAGMNRSSRNDVVLIMLSVVTPFVATISLLLVTIAIFTNEWLHTEENMENPAFNGTGGNDLLSKCTISGLWIFCFTNPGGTLYQCSQIDYFSQEEYSPDPNDSSLAIPYTVTRTVLFFFISTGFLTSGYCSFILGQFKIQRRTLYTFVSGVIFIMTGLLMLFGLVMYISILKSEIGTKLRPRSQLQTAPFTYWYGYSFLLYVGGLISTQLAGICSISLFIHQNAKKSDGSNVITKCPYHRYHPDSYVDTNSTILVPASLYCDDRYYQEPPEICTLHCPAVIEEDGYYPIISRDATTMTVSTIDSFYQSGTSESNRDFFEQLLPPPPPPVSTVVPGTIFPTPSVFYPLVLSGTNHPINHSMNKIHIDLDKKTTPV